MKVLRSIPIILLILVFFAAIGAQEKADSGDAPNNLISPTTYAFSAQTGVPLQDMSSGTTELIAGGTDNGNSLEVPMGLLFRFDNVNFTTFGVNGNGFIRLGMAADQISAHQNSTTTALNNPKIAPYWNDLCVSNGGKVHYKTIGLPGIRRLIVEWRGMNLRRGNNCNGSGTGTFQLWLFEGSGVIQFVYGDGMVGAFNGNGYSVLLHSGPATNFASVTTSNNSVNYSTANNQNQTAINPGTSYSFFPRPVASPVFGTATEITQTSVRLNWMDRPDNETGYIVRRTTDNVNYEIVGELPAGATTIADSGLEPGVHYSYLVTAVTEGAFSDGLLITADTLPARVVASLTAGGLWSAPSTWANGIIPTAADNVIITDGSTVIIDTAAAAFNVTVGGTAGLTAKEVAEGGAPAVLRFGETGGFSLNVANNVTIGAGDTFSTGGGNANAHVLTVQRNLINNGTLDFATNNNQAGALIVFSGKSSGIFGGTGPVTDIMWMRIDKASKASIVELATATFTVQGSIQSPTDSGFLILDSGTFKISGTFPGTHKTLISNPYDIAVDAGLWLNNPNYTIVAQHQAQVDVFGYLRVSAGTYNVGTELNDSIIFHAGSTVIVEGGNINTAGRFMENWDPFSPPLYYTQSGGTVTACTVGQTSTTFACFEFGTTGGSTQITGGKIVIQNATKITNAFDYRYEFVADLSLGNATVQFGNESSANTGTFRSRGVMPNLVIYDGHTLIAGFSSSARDVEIRPGATLDHTGFGFAGESFINNGILRGTSTLSVGGNNPIYSGTGTTDGPVTSLSIRGNFLTLAQENNLRVRSILFSPGGLINSGKLTLGNNDATVSSVSFGFAEGDVQRGFDSSPVFDLGTGGQSVSYSDNSATGVTLATGLEINPARTLVNFTYRGTGIPVVDTTLTLIGGDITVNGTLNLPEGIILTGANKIIHIGAVSRQNGYVDGTIVRPFTANGPYTFHVGQNGYSPVTLNVSNLGGTPPSLSVTAVDATLPGLLPVTSVSRYWKLRETGFMTGTLSFTYHDSDVRGSEVDYRLARTEFGTPSFPPGCILFPDLNTATTPADISFINGDWGIGAQLDPSPVSVSGNVTTAGGQPIRNASLTISGGNLPSPVTVQTGNFGTYSFTGLQAGETYIIRVDMKRYRFTQTPNVQVTPFTDLSNVNFVANP